MKLKELRKRKNITQACIAKNMDISTQVYSRYERGDREPSLETLIKLADYFNVTIDELLGRTPLLFDNAIIEKPEVIELFDQLNPAEQERALGYMERMLEERGIEIKRRQA